MNINIDGIEVRIPRGKFVILNKETFKQLGHEILYFSGIDISNKKIIPENLETTKIVVTNTISDYIFNVDDKEIYVVEFASKNNEKGILRLIDIFSYLRKNNPSKIIQFLIIYSKNITVKDNNIYDFESIVFKPHVLYLSNINASGLMDEVENNFKKNNNTLSRLDICKLSIIANLKTKKSYDIPNRYRNLLINATKLEHEDLIFLVGLLLNAPFDTFFLPNKIKDKILMSKSTQEILKVVYNDDFTMLMEDIANKDNLIAKKDNFISETVNLIAEKDSQLEKNLSLRKNMVQFLYKEKYSIQKIAELTGFSILEINNLVSNDKKSS